MSSRAQAEPDTPAGKRPSGTPETERSKAAQELIALADTRPMLAAEQIMAHLRSPLGCPWDREQTFDTIRRHTLEEVYEVFDAIERRAWPELQDELGDLLLQILFYAQMASEEGRFTLEDVARSLNAKLIRRHPHIFADIDVENSAEVKQNWEAIKRAERSTTPASSRLLAEVSRHMPALTEARKLGSAAARIGFDWEGAQGVLQKAREELDELERELNPSAGRAEQATPHDAIEDEFGDVLFTIVSLSRHLGLDAEMALRRSNAKFRRRFEAMEQLAAARGGSLEQRSAEDLESLWTEAKRNEVAEVSA